MSDSLTAAGSHGFWMRGRTPRSRKHAISRLTTERYPKYNVRNKSPALSVRRGGRGTADSTWANVGMMSRFIKFRSSGRDRNNSLPCQRIRESVCTQRRPRSASTPYSPAAAPAAFAAAPDAGSDALVVAYSAEEESIC